MSAEFGGEASETISTDGFLDNRFQVYQPRSGGHRAGLDALFLSAAINANAKGRLIDLGAGTGVAGLACITGAPGLTHCDLVERNEKVAALLSRSRDELFSDDLKGRMQIISCDAQGLIEELNAAGSYDFAICNPPFNNAGFRASPHQDKASAHAVDDMDVADWIDIARHLLRSGGEFAMIFRPHDLGAVLTRLETGKGEVFGAVQIWPLQPKQDQPASRIVLKAVKGRRTPLILHQAVVLHEASGGFTEQCDAILRGHSNLPNA